MRILITGGAGFIGSHLTEHLLSDPEYVLTIIDNLNDYYSPSLKRENIKHLQEISRGCKLEFIEGDIRDKVLVNRLYKQKSFDQIIHLGAMAGVRYSIQHPDLYYDVNIQGTLNLLNACKDNNVCSFIFASSSSVYGESLEIPFKENQNVDHPISPYAATKKAGEELCYLYHYLCDINVTCLRFFTVYGPRGRPDMAPFKFLDRISKELPIERYGNGNTKRDYTYIDDIINGIVLAAEKDFDYEIFNLARGQITKLKHFIDLIESITGKHALIKPMPMQEGDVSITYGDITKARKLLGYNPRWSIQEGLEATYVWYKKHINSLNSYL